MTFLPAFDWPPTWSHRLPSSSESEELGAVERVGLADRVRGHGQDAGRLGEGRRLLRGQVRGEAVEGDGVVVVGLGADLVEEAVVLGLDVGAVLDGRGGGRSNFLPGAGRVAGYPFTPPG